MKYELLRSKQRVLTNSTARKLAASGFAFTKAGVILPTISGSLSFISSCLIMITILRSKQNTPYHRIMFFMSFWDSLSSLSIALTTIPMPKDVVYDYAGPSYGNTRTCEAQAFIILTGFGFVLTSNIMLNIYYLCTIRYNVVQETFQKYAEPIFLLIAIPLSIFQPIYFVTKETFNPTPYDSFCMMELYPAECRNINVECIRGVRETYKQTVWRVFQYYIAITVSLQLSILIVTMLLIVHTTWSRKEDTEGEMIPRFSQRKSVTLQAFMYICACLMTWIFAVLFSSMPDNRTINALFLLFMPMQGFINLMIFMFHKVYTYKVFHNSTALDSIKIFFTKPWKFADRYLVSNIENIETLQSASRRTPSEIMREIRHKKRPSFSLPSQEIILNDDEIGIKSVDLSIQLSSTRDIDCFFDSNMDLSLADTSKPSLVYRKKMEIDDGNDENNMKEEDLSKEENENEKDQFFDE